MKYCKKKNVGYDNVNEISNFFMLLLLRKENSSYCYLKYNFDLIYSF